MRSTSACLCKSHALDAVHQQGQRLRFLNARRFGLASRRKPWRRLAKEDTKKLSTGHLKLEAPGRSSRRPQQPHHVWSQDVTYSPPPRNLFTRTSVRYQRKIPPRATICLRSSFCDRSLSSSLTMTAFSKSLEAA